MQPAKQRAVVPQEFQAALPPGILSQPIHIGGSLGFAGPDMQPADDIWDALDDEAVSPTGPPGRPGAGVATDLRQNLYDFTVQVTAVSDLVLPYNRNRVYLFLQNRGANVISVAFGKSASKATGMQLAANGGFYEPILATVSSVHAIAAAGSNTLVVIEGFRA